MISGYYLASPSTVIAFPKARRYGGDDLSKERGNLSYETDRGKHWIYTLFERRAFRLDFRVTLAELVAFQTLDTAVQGERLAFHFVPDVSASPLSAIYVRKEKDFRPVEFETGVMTSGGKTRLYDYSLVLTQEPTAAEVDA